MKTRIVCTALLFALASTPVHAQWTWLNPKPQGHTLNDVEFLDDNTAIAVGEAGTVMITHDAGLTWSAKTKVLGIVTPLNRIARVDATTAVAVGDAGVAIKTFDAGAHWLSLPSPSNLDLVDVDFLGAIGLVAAGFQVIRTDDGGATWFPLTQPSVGPIRACELLTPSIVMAAGQLLVRSTDGGQTWEGLFIGGSTANLSFADANNGAFASNFSIYVTSDGGTNWTEHGVDPGQSETGMDMTDLVVVDAGLVAFSASATICDIYSPYRCSSYGEAQYSTNGGLWWTIDQVWPCELFGVAANNTGVMLFVGQGGVIARRVPPAAIVVTNDRPATSGGACTFAGAGRGIVANYVHEVNGIGQTEDVYSTFLRTQDTGTSWTESSKNNALVTDVEFAPTADPVPPAYTAGASYNAGTNVWSAQVLKSTDGGANWSNVWFGASGAILRAIAFATPSRSVAVGDAGTIVVVDNDVASPATFAPGVSLQDVAFATTTIAVAVGRSGPSSARVGTLIRSENGGDSWASLPSVTEWLYGIDFATGSVGIVVGTNGAILRTTNGGMSWDPTPSPTNASLFDVAFSSATRGFISGASGTVLETIDGGATWTALESPTTIDLMDVCALGVDEAIFVGPNQTAVHYLAAPVPTLISSFTGEATSFAVDLAWAVRNDADLVELRVERTAVETRATRAFEGIAPSSRSLHDDSVVPGATYEYVLVAVDRDGGENYSAPIRVTTSKADFTLLSNVPNPFNPSTTIRYILPSRGHLRVSIYDVSGRLVTTLVDESQSAGTHGVEWKGTDAVGTRVSSGVYLVRIEAGKQTLSRKMVLLK